MAIDQLTDDFVAAYADWLGVAFGEAYQLLKEEPLEDVTGDRLQAAAWDESKHPRHPEGVTEGGQFAPKEVGKRLARGIGESARRKGKTPDPAEILKAEKNWARFAETAISQDPRIHAQIEKALAYNRRSDLFVQLEEVFGPDEVLPIVSEATDEATNLLTPSGTAKRLTGNRMSVVRELGLDQAVSGPIKPGQSYVNDTGGAPATLRHEYGHQVEAELTPEQREEFRSFMPNSPDIREELSTYSDITGDEEFPEAFAVVTDPKFREADWPEWAGHMRRFLEGLATRTASGWDESKHPRHPSGTRVGGEFAPKADTFVGLQGFERGPGRVTIEGERPRLPVDEIFTQAPAASLEAAVSDWGHLRELRPDMETVDASQLVPTQDVVSAVRVEEYLQELREDGNLPELLDSVRVVEGDDGRLYIADGHNRVAAAMRAGHQELYLPVIRQEGSSAPRFNLPDLAIDEPAINVGGHADQAARRDLKLRIWDTTPWFPPDDPVPWSEMFHDIASNAEESLTTTDRVFIARDAEGRMSGIAAVQVNEDAVSLMRIGAYPAGFAGKEADYRYTDEPQGVHVKGTGTRLMVEAARVAAEEDKPLQGLALPSAASFYERLGMSVEKSPDYDDYRIKWTPEQARAFVEANS